MDASYTLYTQATKIKNTNCILNNAQIPHPSNRKQPATRGPVFVYKQANSTQQETLITHAKNNTKNRPNNTSPRKVREVEGTFFGWSDSSSWFLGKKMQSAVKSMRVAIWRHRSRFSNCNSVLGFNAPAVYQECREPVS